MTTFEELGVSQPLRKAVEELDSNILCPFRNA